MKTNVLVLGLVLLGVFPSSVRCEPDLVAALATATNHYEWVRLSKEIDKQGLTVQRTNGSAFVRHRLARMSAASSKEREAIRAEILALGEDALPTLIAGITEAVNPAPIFGNTAVANIPIFSMQLLAKMRNEHAVPALIDFIDKFQTDVVVQGPDGRQQNQVVEVLKAITGQDFGSDKSKWKQWYEKRKTLGK